jgi:glycosyltransferase involved in cell wall biosynthesis
MSERILHVVGIMDCAGQETFIMNIYRNINREKLQFDFLVHTNRKGYFDKEIVELGGVIHRLPINNRNIFRVIKRLIDNFKFYVDHPEYKTIHVHASNAKCVLEMISAKLAGVKNIIVHSHNSSSPQKLIHKVFRPILKYFATNFFACSTPASDWMFDEKIITSGKVNIIKNAIETSKFIYNQTNRDEFRKKLNIEDKFVIGHIGRFQPQKNHNFLIEVFKEVKNRYNNSVLILVGDGEDRDKINAKVSDLNLENDIIFIGVSNEIPALLQAFDIFLFPSHYEGLGIVTIEAQAASLKTIVSDAVPREVQVTDLVEFISLNNSAKFWAEHIIKYSIGYNRKKTDNQIIKSGYDINNSAKLLEDYYLSL